jgi:MarR family
MVPQLLPLLDHFARVGRRAYEGVTAPGGLRPRHLVALKLLSEQRSQSQQGLADALSLDPSNVVGLLNELEERDLVVRRRDPLDRRRHIVELSTPPPAVLSPRPGTTISRKARPASRGRSLS